MKWKTISRLESLTALQKMLEKCLAGWLRSAPFWCCTCWTEVRSEPLACQQFVSQKPSGETRIITSAFWVHNAIQYICSKPIPEVDPLLADCLLLRFIPYGSSLWAYLWSTPPPPAKSPAIPHSTSITFRVKWSRFAQQTPSRMNCSYKCLCIYLYLFIHIYLFVYLFIYLFIYFYSIHCFFHSYPFILPTAGRLRLWRLAHTKCPAGGETGQGR